VTRVRARHLRIQRARCTDARVSFPAQGGDTCAWGGGACGRRAASAEIRARASTVRTPRRRPIIRIISTPSRHCLSSPRTHSCRARARDSGIRQRASAHDVELSLNPSLAGPVDRVERKMSRHPEVSRFRSCAPERVGQKSKRAKRQNRT